MFNIKFGKRDSGIFSFVVWETNSCQTEGGLGREIEEEEKKKAICLRKQSASKTAERNKMNRTLTINLTAPYGQASLYSERNWSRKHKREDQTRFHSTRKKCWIRTFVILARGQERKGVKNGRSRPGRAVTA